MYQATLKDGRAIAIPSWPIDVALENLTHAGKYLGTENVINIASLNIPAVIVAIMGSDEPKLCASIIKQFVCQARIAGSKIEIGTLDTMFDNDLSTVTELFAHVVHAQYHDFFESGLAKAHSPSK
jgi:hypothetical protein